MLKVLVPHLMASGLAALIGAGVGGWITHDIITEDTRTQFVVDAYSSYLKEASRALFLTMNSESTDGTDLTNGVELTIENKARMGSATGTLMMSASEDVMCWALSFEKAITSANPDGKREYHDLLFSIREEVLGEKIEGSSSGRECTWSLM